MILSPTQKTDFDKASKRVAKMHRKIRAARDAAKPKRAKRLAIQYMNCADAKYTAAVEAYRKLKPHRRKKNIDLRQIANSLDPWQGTQEDVILHFKPKKNNDSEYRPIFDFGLKNRAMQILVCRALRPQVDLSPNQFEFNGGLPEAIKTVLKNLNEGYKWVSEIDIQSCFPSFNGKKLVELLPIPPKITEHIVLSRYLSIIPGNILSIYGYGSAAEWEGEEFDPVTVAVAEARRGISHGSASSSLVCEFVLEPVVSALPVCGRAVAYVDNILLMAKSEDDGVSMFKSAGDALVGHLAGPFMPSVIRPLSNYTEFDFLGFAFSRTSGGWSVAPSVLNLARFEHRLSRGLKSLGKPPPSPEVRQRKIKKLRGYVKSWAGAFSLWDGASDLKEASLKAIQQAIEHSN